MYALKNQTAEFRKNTNFTLLFVIKISKSVTHRSTPLFQKYGARSLVKADLVYFSQSEACLFVRIALSRDLNLTFHHLAVLELSDEKNRTSK